jgi:hypothetical protein
LPSTSSERLQFERTNTDNIPAEGERCQTRAPRRTIDPSPKNCLRAATQRDDSSAPSMRVGRNAMSP